MTPSPQYQGKDYRPAGKLEGKVAVITGGDSGIGRSVAFLFALEGAQVAIICLPEEQSDAHDLRRALEAAGKGLIIITGDVQDPDFCVEAVQRIVEKLGGVDILVNNAAYQNHVFDVEALSLEQWEKTFKTNIQGYFHMTRACLSCLGSGSAIINTGSITGLEGSDGLLDYSATKGAIHAFTKSLAKMLQKRGIRVNCVAPGPVWTPLNAADSGRSAAQITGFGSDTPMRRPAQPEEVAPSYVFLASNADSSYITGEVLTLLGGEATAG